MSIGPWLTLWFNAIKASAQMNSISEIIKKYDLCSTFSKTLWQPSIQVCRCKLFLNSITKCSPVSFMKESHRVAYSVSWCDDTLLSLWMSGRNQLPPVPTPLFNTFVWLIDWNSPIIWCLMITHSKSDWSHHWS